MILVISKDAGRKELQTTYTHIDSNDMVTSIHIKAKKSTGLRIHKVCQRYKRPVLSTIKANNVCGVFEMNTDFLNIMVALNNNLT